jgi:hypothetical protein
MALDNIINEIKSKPVYMIAGSAILLMMLAPKLFKAKRRHRRIKSLPAHRYRRRRSVKRSYGSVRRKYTKGGKAKKPWQVKGSRAAKLHMAKLRRMR